MIYFVIRLCDFIDGAICSNILSTLLFTELLLLKAAAHERKWSLYARSARLMTRQSPNCGVAARSI